MDSDPLRSRSPCVVAVVLLTVLYGGERLLASTFSVSYLLPGTPGSAFWAGWAAFAVAYLVWQGRLVGWTAAVVLYGFLLLDFALGATVFGFREVPVVPVVLVVLGYLLLERDQFRDGPQSTG